MAKGVHKITAEFESELCFYTNSPYAVCVDNQSNALFLALVYERIHGNWDSETEPIVIPKHTYPSVPCEIIHAGGNIKYVDNTFLFGGTGINTVKGAYNISPTSVYYSALRFTKDMYIKNTFMCISFTGAYKHLKLSKGGAILTDDEHAYKWFKKARFSGRDECSYHDDNFDNFPVVGWNFYMMPEISARGLLMMQQFYNADGTRKHNEDLELPYPDLSKYKVFNTI